MDDREHESLELDDRNDGHGECGSASVDFIGIGEEKNEKDFVPKLWMEFLSEDAAYDFYKEYARRTGFSIRRSSATKVNGVLTHRVLCCNKAGVKGIDKRNENVKHPQPESRTDCKAEIRISLRASGKYVIRRFTLEHNHDMVAPEMVHLLRSHGECSNASVDCIGIGEEKKEKDFVPKLGMEFLSEDSAYDFYNEYAKRIGFSIRKSSGTKANGVLTHRVLCCNKAGVKGLDKRNENVKKPQPESRTDCKAEIRISLRASGKYVIRKFTLEHNHDMAAPEMIHLLRSHKNLTVSQAFKDIANCSGTGPKATKELMAKKVGGHKKKVGDHKNLGFIPIDYKNYLHKKRDTSMHKGDAGGLLEYFQMKQNESPFFYAIQLDEDELITNIFWADSRMIVDYNAFGDVVCFVTTYKTNKLDRPFALFVGVNHHRQTVVFGAALLYDESTESFEWIFKTFVKAMSGKSPKTILTDQDIAMSNAIAYALPDAYHRLCIWHIYQNATKRIHWVFEHFMSFEKDLRDCIYEYEGDAEFQEGWNNMIEKYSLQGQPWLQELYNERRKWSLAYGRNTFCANMNTTQWPESMNNVLKQYLTTQKDLKCFLENFDRVLADCRYTELKADCNMSQTMSVSATPFIILDHAKVVYTPVMFEIFQKEVLPILNCQARLCDRVGNVSQYKVVNLRESRHRERTVTYDSSEMTITCSCKKFEFEGILCCHALRVLDKNDTLEIPSRYLLKRWTKDAKSGGDFLNDHSTIAEDNPSLEVEKRYKELYYIFRQIATRASEHTESYNVTITDAKKMLLNVDEVVKHATPIESRNVTTSIHCNSEHIDNNAPVLHVTPVQSDNAVTSNQCDSDHVESVDLRPTSVLCELVPHVTPDEPDNVATSTRCQNEEEDVSKRRKSKNDCEQLEDNVDKPAKKKSKLKEIGATQVSTPSSQILTNQVASIQFSIPSKSTQESICFGSIPFQNLYQQRMPNFYHQVPQDPFFLGANAYQTMCQPQRHNFYQPGKHRSQSFSPMLQEAFTRGQEERRD